MKRSVLVLFILLVAVAVVAVAQQPKFVSFQVRQVLDRAIDNEREAAARYDAFAASAEEEGYPGAASLFRAAARAERVHARRFAEAMKERGLDVPEERQYRPTVGSTAENLRTSSSAELSERDGIYRDAITAAQDARDENLAKIFDQTRDTEVEHANLMIAANRQLEGCRVPKTHYVCDHCGYTTDVNLPMCVLCRKNTHPEEVK
jgi:rubrerythrin